MSDDSPTTELRRIRLPSPGLLLVCTLLVIACVVAVPIGIRYHRQQALIEYIEAVDGSIETEPVGPAWLHGVVVKTMSENKSRGFDEIVGVSFALCTEVNNADLWRLAGLMSLQELDLQFTSIDDGGLQYLTGFSELRQIQLTGTDVSREGVVELRDQLPFARLMTLAIVFTSSVYLLLSRAGT